MNSMAPIWQYPHGSCIAGAAPAVCTQRAQRWPRQAALCRLLFLAPLLGPGRGAPLKFRPPTWRTSCRLRAQPGPPLAAGSAAALLLGPPPQRLAHRGAQRAQHLGHVDLGKGAAARGESVGGRALWAATGRALARTGAGPSLSPCPLCSHGSSACLLSRPQRGPSAACLETQSPEGGAQRQLPSATCSPGRRCPSWPACGCPAPAAAAPGGRPAWRRCTAWGVEM